MAKDGPNACEVLSANESVGEFRKDFVCMNDSLHENMQDNPEVIILYVAMVVFVMVFLKMVTRKPRTAAPKPSPSDKAPDDKAGA
ncbi:MAG: hypothetical protein ACON37_04080 [Candidatus Puniceispirillaceae bacterium]